MFTCMDITMAPGVAGGIFSGQIHSFSVGNIHVDWWVSSKREKRELRSQSVNRVTTNPCSHNHPGRLDHTEAVNKDKQ